MKVSKLFKKISAFALLFVMVFGLFGMSENTITADAATDKVNMYYFDHHTTLYGVNYSTVFIQVNDNASNKAVSVHYQYSNFEEEEWRDSQASYVTTLSDGSQIWKAEIEGYSVKYAVKYVGDGQTYWDNNNGNDYTIHDDLGSAPIRVNRIQSHRNNYTNYRIEVTLKNLAYTKVVKVRYTEDNWATYKDVALNYDSSDTSKGTEIWSTYLPLDESKKSSFQYCVYYQVNGQTYWDSRFGSNYDANYDNNF